MPNITFIGAGSFVFTQKLCSDILLTPALQDSVISLMDIDAARLAHAEQMLNAMIAQRGVRARVKASLDRRVAVTDADFVITTFQQGGLAAYQLDIDIPQKYGIEQCVGDTLGPGGAFRAARTIPVLTELCDDLAELAPNAVLLNYVNPMAANCWALDLYTQGDLPFVGLCHSVQDTSEMLARWLGLPYEALVYHCAGINHQAWFLELQHRPSHEDLYARLHEVIQHDDIIAQEPVRTDIMKHFGYFVTESSGHASEYMPYFRKSAAMINTQLVPRFTHAKNDWYDFARTGGYLRHCQQRLEKSEVSNPTDSPVLAGVRSHEYGSHIIEAMVTNHPTRIHGNVPNRGLISNLPEGCCVEVACLVDARGVQPTAVGALPSQLAALNRTNINFQELLTQAALYGDREALIHAVMLDPLASAVCTLDQIRAMVNEMLTAQAQWLPQFQA